MKTAVKTLLLLAPILVATIAVAQIQQNAFKHIIIVVQENRTPDNL
jgi:phospholipase C